MHALGLTGVMGLLLALVLLHLARQEALALVLAAADNLSPRQRRSGQLAAFFGFGQVNPDNITPNPLLCAVFCFVMYPSLPSLPSLNLPPTICL